MNLETITPVIWDPDADAILVRGNLGEHTLPSLAFWDAGFGASLTGAILDALGLTTSLLDSLDPDVYVVALRGSPTLSKTEYQWVPVVDSRLSAADDFWVSRWLERRDCPLRPWFDLGWMDQVLAYIDAVLIKFGQTRTGQFFQIKHWALSSVIRIETTKGAVFFKAVPPAAAIEPFLLAHLADRWPHSVPTLLAHSPHNNWWITEDLRGRKGPTLTREELFACIELLARMHIDTATDSSFLHDLPINQRSLEQLAASIPSLLGRMDRWNATPAEHEHWWPLDAEQRDIWCSIGPALTEQVYALANYSASLGIPSSLTHGDVHPGNMAVRDGRPILLDWGNATITHPFFDLAMLLKSVDVEIAEGCLEAYFGTWHRAGWDTGDLWMLWNVAKPVSALFEVDRALRLCDELGRDYQFSMISVLYGWIRRLLGTIFDSLSPALIWSTSGIAAKR